MSLEEGTPNLLEEARAYYYLLQRPAYCLSLLRAHDLPLLRAHDLPLIRPHYLALMRNKSPWCASYSGYDLSLRT